MASKTWDWIKSRPLRAWIVIAWLLIGCSLTSWWLLFLLLPIYWQVYLKADLAPSWW